MTVLLAIIAILLAIIVIYLIGGIRVTMPRVIGAVIIYLSYVYLESPIAVITALGM